MTRVGDKVKKFIYFLAGLALIGGLAMAADKDDSNILPVIGAGGSNLVTNINTQGSSIIAIWASRDSSFKEPSITVFPYGAAADSFSIYLVTAPNSGIMIETFRTQNFDSIHLHRPDSTVFFSAYVGWR
jgi:hypothetical protein